MSGNQHTLIFLIPKFTKLKTGLLWEARLTHPFILAGVIEVHFFPFQLR